MFSRYRKERTPVLQVKDDFTTLTPHINRQGGPSHENRRLSNSAVLEKHRN